ncbi:hypothetical protein, partial [Streptomyces hydrogenans]
AAHAKGLAVAEATRAKGLAEAEAINRDGRSGQTWGRPGSGSGAPAARAACHVRALQFGGNGGKRCPTRSIRQLCPSTQSQTYSPAAGV